MNGTDKSITIKNAISLITETLGKITCLNTEFANIHIAASKCPRVHAGVVESVPAALRAITGNGVNVLAMGAFYVAPAMGCDIADAYLGAELGTGYEWWHNFYEFHKLAIDELDAFDYEEYKANGFKVKHLGDCHCELYDRPEGSSPVPLMCKR